MRLEFCAGVNQTVEVNTQTFIHHIVSDCSSYGIKTHYVQLWGGGKAYEIVSHGKIWSMSLFLGLCTVTLPPAPGFDFPDLIVLCASPSAWHLTTVLTRVTNSSQSAWNFLSFEMESPMSLEPPSPGQTGTVGHPNLNPLNLRPWLGISFAFFTGAGWSHVADRLVIPGFATLGELQGNWLLGIPVKQSLTSWTRN